MNKLPISFVLLTPDYLESFAPLDFTIDVSTINNQRELEDTFNQQTKVNCTNFRVNRIFNIENSNLDHIRLSFLWRVIELWKNTPDEFKPHLGKKCSYINNHGQEIPNRTIIGFENGDVYFLEDQQNKGFSWLQCATDDETWHAELKDDLANGFVISDPDDNFQRFKRINKTTYLFKVTRKNETIEDTIDINNLDLDEAVKGFYSNFKEVQELYGESAGYIAAECSFENNNYPIWAN